MKEEQIRVLKTISQATNRMDINTFAHAVNLTPNQAMATLQDLAKEGFLRRVGNGYGLTAKGKNLLKATAQVPAEFAFNFYLGVDKPLGLTAQSLAEFYVLTSQVGSDSLDFHLYRGDFERWISEVCKDTTLSEAFSGLKASGLKGEELRQAILEAIDAKYDIGELF